MSDKCPECGGCMVPDPYNPRGSMCVGLAANISYNGCGYTHIEDDEIIELAQEVKPPNERLQVLSMLRRTMTPYMSVRAVGPNDLDTVTIENLTIDGMVADIVFRFYPTTGAMRSVELRRDKRK